MNKQTIENTAICYWSEENGCYLVSSNVYLLEVGGGDTPEKAWQSFRNCLDSAYNAYLEGRVMGLKKPEDPATDEPFKTPFQASISLLSEVAINSLSKKYNCSPGDVIDYLVAYHEIAQLPAKPTADTPST